MRRRLRHGEDLITRFWPAFDTLEARVPWHDTTVPTAILSTSTIRSPCVVTIVDEREDLWSVSILDYSLHCPPGVLGRRGRAVGGRLRRWAPPFAFEESTSYDAAPTDQLVRMIHDGCVLPLPARMPLTPDGRTSSLGQGSREFVSISPVTADTADGAEQLRLHLPGRKAGRATNEIRLACETGDGFVTVVLDGGGRLHSLEMQGLFGAR